MELPERRGDRCIRGRKRGRQCEKSDRIPSSRLRVLPGPGCGCGESERERFAGDSRATEAEGRCAGGAKIEKVAMDPVAGGCGGSGICVDRCAVVSRSTAGERAHCYSISGRTCADGDRQVRTGTDASPTEWSGGEKARAYGPLAVADFSAA